MTDEGIVWLASAGAIVGAIAFVWYVLTQRGPIQHMPIHDSDDMNDGRVMFSMSSDAEDDGDDDDD